MKVQSDFDIRRFSFHVVAKLQPFFLNMTHLIFLKEKHFLYLAGTHCDGNRGHAVFVS